MDAAVAEAADVPFVLLGYQQGWLADAEPLKVMEKSRRVGLSWAAAAAAVTTAATTPADGGQDVWYIGYNQDMAREFIGDCAFWARSLHGVAAEVEEDVLPEEGVDGKDIFTFRIKFASGQKVTALSSRPANLRGKQGVVIIDEAAFHDDLEGLLKAAMALLIWGGRVRVISTHNGEVNPFNDLIQEIRSGKREGSVHRITFREAVEQGLYKRVCMRQGIEWTPEGEVAWLEKVYGYYGDDAAEELDVIPSHGEGRYLSRSLIESVQDASVPIIRLEREPEFTYQPDHIREAEIRDWCDEHLAPLLERLNPNLFSFLGEDFARTSDLTVLWPAQQQPNLKLHTPFIVELRGIPYAQQRQIAFYLMDRLPRFRAAAFDATGNGGELAEAAAQRYGRTRVAEVKIGTEWYRQNMPRLKAAFEDRTTNVPKHADIMADLLAIRRVNGVAVVPKDARVKGADGKYRHGDAAVALVMVLYAIHEMEPAETDYIEVPRDSGRYRERLDEDADDHKAVMTKGGAW